MKRAIEPTEGRGSNAQGTMTDKPTKGGAREGSGKKRLLLPRQTFTIRLSAAARARLTELCRERVTTAGKLIDELILKQ